MEKQISSNPVGQPKAYSYIRFSTPEQKKGDSLRRQVQATEEYAKKNNLILDKSLNMQDEGLSAFHGTQILKGALGRFLELIKIGKILPGSYLIVESLDRLSRETVLEALEQFLSIIRHGICLVTLLDGMTYSKESIEKNWTQLIISLSNMSRAHEESLIKSKRLKAVWENKRKNGKTKKLTSKCSAWMKFDKEKDEFVLIPERAELVKRIFKVYLNGKGIVAITRLLNEEQIPSWSHGRGWNKSYVQTILHSHASKGDFMPSKLKNNKAVFTGEIIKDYFPGVVSRDDWNRVQKKFKDNTFFRGKTGKVDNLFTHLAKCADCGFNMIFQNTGKPPKGDKYLACGFAIRGNECKTKFVRYNLIEETVLQYCAGLSVSDILDDGGNKSKISILLGRVASIVLSPTKIERDSPRITRLPRQ